MVVVLAAAVSVPDPLMWSRCSIAVALAMFVDGLYLHPARLVYLPKKNDTTQHLVCDSDDADSPLQEVHLL